MGMGDKTDDGWICFRKVKLMSRGCFSSLVPVLILSREVPKGNENGLSLRRSQCFISH